MTLTPHPVKDELIMFGGEYFDGQKVRFRFNSLVRLCSEKVDVQCSLR